LNVSIRAEASVVEFCEHAWGLDTGKIATILSRDWTVSQSMLSRYNRQPAGSSTRRRPFRAIWSNIQADVLGHFGMSYRDTQDIFWDKDESYHPENIFAEGAPDLLRIWKSTIQVGNEADVVPEWEDVKAFVVFSQVKSTNTYLDDEEVFMPSALEFPVLATNDLCPHENAPIGENLSASLKRRRAHKRSQCTSTRKRTRSNRGITEDELRLATYAVECLADYTRRYATGILVDGSRISLYYMDRNLSIRTTPFDFGTQEGAQYLALTIFALTQCDNIHTGFDPYIRRMQLSDDYCLHKLASHDHDVTNFGAECFVFPQPLNAHPVFYLVEDCIHQFCGLFGHGMSTFTVQKGALGLPIIAPKRILKSIWRGDTSPSDAEIVAWLKSSVPELEKYLPIMEDIGKWDARTLDFPWVKMSLAGPKYGEDMTLQVSLTQPDVHLWEVETLDNFKNVFKNCLIGTYNVTRNETHLLIGFYQLTISPGPKAEFFTAQLASKVSAPTNNPKDQPTLTTASSSIGSSASNTHTVHQSRYPTSKPKARVPSTHPSSWLSTSPKPPRAPTIVTLCATSTFTATTLNPSSTSSCGHAYIIASQTSTATHHTRTKRSRVGLTLPGVQSVSGSFSKTTNCSSWF
jgi:hypothetical protein